MPPISRTTGRAERPARKPLLAMYWGGGLEKAGGIGRIVGNLLDAGAARELPYEIRCIDTRGPYSIWLSPFYFTLALLRTVWLALWRRPFAAHVNLADKGSTVRKLVLCRLLALLRVPYLLHLHAGNYDRFYGSLSPWAQREVRRGFAKAALVVVLGQTWRQLAVRQLDARPAAVRIIRNGTRDPGHRVPGPKSEAPIILMLGDIKSWKGMTEMIEALGTPELRARPWQLVCAGSGDIDRYRDAACNAGIAERVRFTGWISRKEVAALLARAAMLALPSYVEGLSVTLVEALAHGLPVIATPVGAHPDILVDGHNALLVPKQDAPALAQALLRLLDDPELADRIGRNGRHLFETSLDIAGIERQFESLYAELFAGHGACNQAQLGATPNSNEMS